MQKLMSVFGLSKDKDNSPETKASNTTPSESTSSSSASTPAAAPSAATATSAAPSASAAPEDDCLACTVPCVDYPEDIVSKIEYDDDISSSVKPYDRHLVVCTGVSGNEWPSKIDDQRGSFSALVSDVTRKLKESGQKVNVNSSEDQSKDENGQVIKDIHQAQKADIILFPDMIRFHQVDQQRLKQLCEYIVSPAAKQWIETLRTHHNNSSSSSSSAASSSTTAAGSFSPPSSVPGLSLPHTVLSGVHVLVCVHLKRDNRCGITAPILLQQFSNVCSSLKIPSSSVTFHKVSHVGGHRWAANVIVYPHGMWFGKVKPQHAEGIIKTFVFNNGKGVEKLEDITRGHCRTKGIPAW